MDWYKKVIIDNYANFEGRARRSEYWYYVLMNIIITVLLYFITIAGILAESPIIAITGGGIIVIYLIGIIIPTIAVSVRRLHDTNKTGWLYLLNLIPSVGGLVLLIFYCIESDNESNQYGPNPKLTYSEDINSIGTE
ncbi:DUF805 domain-containing protein [Flavobacteriaceae bacterium R38]|nr:DUF805 domain-containing protein [Flavobacteriaceae bacterium R38]